MKIRYHQQILIIVINNTNNNYKLRTKMEFNSDKYYLKNNCFFSSFNLIRIKF